jgi:predicted neutral ceramidase superfamily lipid hydrolase
VRVDRHFLVVGAGIAVLAIEAVWMIAFNISVIASATSLHESLSDALPLQLLLLGVAAVPFLIAVALLKRSVLGWIVFIVYQAVFLVFWGSQSMNS